MRLGFFFVSALAAALVAGAITSRVMKKDLLEPTDAYDDLQE
jgi:hypothetical protein